MAQEGQKAYTEQYVQNIADAIRAKNGQQTTYRISEMAQAITDMHDYDSVLNKTISRIESSSLTSIGSYVCCGGLDAGSYSNVLYVNCPNLTSIGAYAFHVPGYLRQVYVGAEPSASKKLTIDSYALGQVDGSTTASSKINHVGFENDNFIGICATVISNNSTTNPISINGSSVTAQANDIVYDSENFNCYKWNGSKWVIYEPIAYIEPKLDAFYQSYDLHYLNFKFCNYRTSETGTTAAGPFIIGVNKTGLYSIKWEKHPNASPSQWNNKTPKACKSAFSNNPDLVRVDLDENIQDLKTFTSESTLPFYNDPALRILILRYNGVVNIRTDTSVQYYVRDSLTTQSLPTGLYDVFLEDYLVYGEGGNINDNAGVKVMDWTFRIYNKNGTHYNPDTYNPSKPQNFFNESEGFIFRGTMFETDISQVKVYVPRAQIASYKEAPVWKFMYYKAHNLGNELFFALEDIPI